MSENELTMAEQQEETGHVCDCCLTFFLQNARGYKAGNANSSAVVEYTGELNASSNNASANNSEPGTYICEHALASDLLVSHLSISGRNSCTIVLSGNSCHVSSSSL